MILTLTVYALFLVLVLWGGKFAGFGKTFHEDFSALRHTKSLRGLAVLAILFHHISQQQAFRQTGELAGFVDIGIFLVSIFFFSSGYGLIKSINTKNGYLNEFLRQRIVRQLIIPFYLCTALYAVCYAVIGKTFSVSNWVCGITGITLFNEHAWYLVVLLILYLAFYLAFYNISHRDDCFALIFVLIVVMIGIFCLRTHIVWWRGPEGWYLSEELYEQAGWWMKEKMLWFHGEWWVNTCMTFLVGMIFADNERKITAWFRRFYWVKLITLILLFIGSLMLLDKVFQTFDFYSELKGMNPGIREKFICVCAQQPVVILFVIIVYAAMMKYVCINPVNHFLGNHSLDIYLVNYMVMYSLGRLIYSEHDEAVIAPDHRNLVLYVVAVIVISIMTGFLFRKVADLLRRPVRQA